MADILSTLSRAVTPVWAMDLAAAHFAAAVALLRTALKGRVPGSPYACCGCWCSPGCSSPLSGRRPPGRPCPPEHGWRACWS